MNFLQPILLIGLPLALLPIIIHLINQHRHRTVKWAAMMFLLDAKKLTKGIARLRQILILALRVLAVLFLLFAASRPLAGGWLALTGGHPDTVLILLDRSASMEQQILETGESKRSAAVSKLSDLLEKTASNSNIVLIDSAALEPTPITEPSSLADIPEVSSTATTADIPKMLQQAISYLDTDESGRTDIWIASDLRQSDWQTGSGKWQSLRSDLAARETVRLFLLTYPETRSENFSVTVDNVKRRRAPEGMQLVMDLRIRRPSGKETATTLPVEFTINGTRTVEQMTVSNDEMVRLGYVIPLGQNGNRGWGRVDLPADGNLSDNTAYFVFDDEAVRKTVIVSDDPVTSSALAAAAGAEVESDTTYETETIATDQLTRIPWEETALLFWHAPLPDPGTPETALLRQHVESGRVLFLLPPLEESKGELFGFRWKEWVESSSAALAIEWWRTEAGLLANTQSGDPLPAGDLSIFRHRPFTGESQPLMRVKGDELLAARLISETPGTVYVMGTLPRTDYSSLATEGVVFFVLTHRALSEGASAVSTAQIRNVGTDVFSSGDDYTLIDSAGGRLTPGGDSLMPAAFSISRSEGNDRLIALNRPDTEDDLRVVPSEALDALLEGVEFREVADELDSGNSLASEVWRAFLIAMALALLVEAILCVPPKSEDAKPAVGFS